jgi:hypothetical protein
MSIPSQRITLHADAEPLEPSRVEGLEISRREFGTGWDGPVARTSLGTEAR